ncbi:HNH endonuclease signature motif containing protein [Pengzhenrongella sicca]|uniref:HNH endonuclease n=1 Tax=Pengzhenrongella sicca TaxID=2819238 RepID=A0A8A4ZDV1_9MICO|nr:HNH endonuclease signature motif containing protein [Pengzhenrongella sicca]QTE30142.1 HNH endonuclease [Pengzhenrongella sicca]
MAVAVRLSAAMASLVGLSLTGVVAAVLRAEAARQSAAWLTVAAEAAQVELTQALEVARAATLAALAHQFEFAQTLDEHAPNAALVGVLEGIDLAAAHDAVLIEAAAGWERITSLAAARQAEVLAELARRREAARLGEFTGDEVAARMALTRSVAEAKIELGLALAEAPAVHAALVAGVIDHRKATALVSGVAHLDTAAAATVLDAVLDAAPSLTVPALKAKMRRVELTVNPKAVAERAARDIADRNVRITPAAGAMAWLTAFLPADAAMTVFTAIDALAASADPADPRGVDARRADALTDVCAHVLTHGVTPDGTPITTEQGRRPHLQVVAAATTLLGLDEVPGELAGYGPIPADMVRAIAADATWRRIFTDPATGHLTGIGPRGYRPGADLTATVLARDLTCTFPGCRMPAWKCDLDHRVAFDHDEPGDSQTTEENVHSLCRHHHRLKTYGGWTVIRDAATGDTFWFTPTNHRYRRPNTAFTDDPRLPPDPPDSIDGAPVASPRHEPDAGEPPF